MSGQSLVQDGYLNNQSIAECEIKVETLTILKKSRF